jgi:hypothetical protein
MSIQHINQVKSKYKIILNYMQQGLSTLALLILWLIFVVGAVQCILGCLQAILASRYSSSNHDNLI